MTGLRIRRQADTHIYGLKKGKREAGDFNRNGRVGDLNTNESEQNAQQ